ncbi:hypothetical protein EDD15DRAFT_2292425 [Pisolithus albus]|nr:hypothetical protein EDD15DRAFT_2292425 [Pisolithus albus]
MTASINTDTGPWKRKYDITETHLMLGMASVMTILRQMVINSAEKGAERVSQNTPGKGHTILAGSVMVASIATGAFGVHHVSQDAQLCFSTPPLFRVSCTRGRAMACSVQRNSHAHLGAQCWSLRPKCGDRK